MKRKYVVAATYREFSDYLKENNLTMWQATYVSRPEALIGIHDTEVWFIKNWPKRHDIAEIMKRISINRLKIEML